MAYRIVVFSLFFIALAVGLFDFIAMSGLGFPDGYISPYDRWRLPHHTMLQAAALISTGLLLVFGLSRPSRLSVLGVLAIATAFTLVVGWVVY